jgi:mono/diheme cytochrome c family protein
MIRVRGSRLRSCSLALTVLATVVPFAPSDCSSVHAGAEPPTVLRTQGTTVAARKSVWDGVYTEDQAVRGQGVYQQECAQCHMEDLLGDGFAPSLVGSPFYLRWSGLTVADLLLDIKASMPEQAPDSLELAGYADVVTYLLKSNKLPAGANELPTDVAVLTAIVIESKPKQ